MHFKGREAGFPMLVWPGIKDFEVRSKRRGRERENRTKPIALNYVRASGKL